MTQTVLEHTNNISETINFAYGEQTIPQNWHQGYDYSWYTANPSGHGIEPNTKEVGS